MDPDGKLFDSRSIENVTTALTEIIDNRLEVFHEEVVRLNNENAQQINNVKAAVTEIVNELAHQIENIKTAVKENDNKLEAFREDIREIIKEKIGNTNNESDQEINEKAEKRMELRHTYSSPASVYDNDIKASASDNYLTLPNKMNVNTDRSGISETQESHYDHSEVHDGEKGDNDDMHEEDDDDNADDDDGDEGANFASTVKSFFESSTLHGFHNLIDTAIWVRVLWILAMIGAFIPLSMQVVGLANDYLSFQVSTDVSVSQGDKIFPAITVCNNRRFIISKVSKLPYFESLYDSKDKNGYKQYGSKYWQKLLQIYYHKFRPADFLDLGAEVVGTLKFNKRGIMVRPVPYHGSCYSVKVPPNTTELSIAFNLHVNESIDILDKNAGFTAYLTDNPSAYHHPLFEPVLEIEVPLGHYAVSRISYDVIERLNGNYAQCQENEDLFYERTGLGYTQSACMHECSFRDILSKCGCIINPRGQKYFPFWIKTNRSECERCLSWTDTSPENCNCKPKCHARIYSEVRNVINKIFDILEQGTISYGVLRPILELIGDVGGIDHEEQQEWIKNNTAILTIILPNTPYKTFKQRPRYPLLRFMADIGGTMGLYLGASVLTTFEFVQMAISGVLHVVRKIKQNYFP